MTIVDADTVEALVVELVAARSTNPPGDERAVADVVERAAQQLGLPPGRRIAARPERPNLLFEIGQGTPRLLLAAHMDTMPPGDLDAWNGDPWAVRRDGDRLIGLGIADMKASIAAMLHAAARLQEDPPRHGTLVLAFTADEEAGSAEGMAWLCENGAIVADAAIMTEPSSVGPTSWSSLFVAQRGSCISELVARGRPGHSAEAVDSAERAGWALARALSALLEGDPFSGCEHPVDGTTPTVNVATMVRGGEVPFAHPAELRATIEVRTLPGQTADGVRAALQRVIDEAGLAGRATIEAPRDGLGWIPAGQTVTDERLLGAARAAWRAVLAAEPREAVLPAGTDSSHVDALGIPALPTFGPGTLAVAHRPEESIDAADLSRAVDMFESVARHYLEGPR